MKFFALFLSLISFNIFSFEGVKDDPSSRSPRPDLYKIKYKAEFTYLENDGTKILLPKVKGVVLVSTYPTSACTIRIGGWDSQTVHFCRLPSLKPGAIPGEIAVSDDTFTTIALESVNYLLDNKRDLAKKIFENANLYIDNVLAETRPVNQTTQGEFILPFKGIDVVLEQPELLNRIQVKFSFKSIHRTR